MSEYELFDLLGLTPSDFQQVRQAPSFEEAENSLAQLKERAKREYRKQVFELHPDRNAGDEAKAQVLQALNDLMQKLEKIQVQRPLPTPPPFRWVRVNPTSASTWPSYDGGVSVAFYVNGVRVS